MASLITIKLNKNAGSSWGFRLQGGKDFATPLCIQKVNVGSVAAQAGLQAGDAIVSIGNRDALSLRHKEAQDAIVTAGNNFDMVVQRGSQIWKPAVAPLPEKIISDGVTVVTKTSLASSQKIVNTQYNSPVNIYSEDSIAETLSAQAEVLGKGGVLGINFQKFAREEKVRTDSPTYKLLHGEEEPQRKQRPASQNFPDSSSPFQRDVTQEQKGYYNINERLYCDVHAKQAARSNPPAPNFVPVTVQPGVAPPVGAVTAPQASRMKVPAAFQHGGPAPVPAPAPQPEMPQPVVQEVPEPQPEPVFEPTPVPLAVPEVPSQPSSQFVEEEGVQSPPLLNGGTTEEEALLPPQDTSDHVTEERHISENESKPVENGYVEETEKEVSAQEAEPLTDSQSSKLIQNGENLIPEPISDIKPVETSACETISEIKEIDLPEKIEAVPMPDAEVSEPALEVAPEPETVLQQIPTESVPSTEPAPTFEPSQPTVTELPLYKPPEPFSVDNAFENQPVGQNTGSLHGTDGTFSNVSHFHSEESRFTETKMSSSSSVFQSSVGIEAVTQRAPAPAPAPIKPFAPAPAPAPAPVAAAPMKPAPAPAYSTSANPQGFGAPAGDINVRSHIPKKGDVPAPMTFAPIPAPAPVPLQVPNPTSNFGANTMPRPVPPPGMGGKIGPGGPPARGIPQAPGHRSAPRRGRGVMNQASASRIPVCNACQRQIRGPFVSALGKTWCPDHFICATSTCKRNIIDMGFVEEQGLLYCEVCYENFLAPICGKCDKRIKGDCLNAVGKQFHPECFCCAYCGKVFGSGAFYLEDGLPYCETDWNDLFTTKCVGCNFPIEAGDRWVEALNNNYHSQCFKCSKCHKNLEGQSFFAKGGKPFCKAHAQRGF